MRCFKALAHCICNEEGSRFNGLNTFECPAQVRSILSKLDFFTVMVLRRYNLFQSETLNGLSRFLGHCPQKDEPAVIMGWVCLTIRGCYKEMVRHLPESYMKPAPYLLFSKLNCSQVTFTRSHTTTVPPY